MKVRLSSFLLLFVSAIVSAATNFSSKLTEADSESYTHYKTNRLDGGVNVRTTDKSETEEIHGKGIRNYKKGWLQNNIERTAGTTEDWVFRTSSSNDGKPGCKKTTKQSENLTRQRGINAPPSVWIVSSPAPSDDGCFNLPSDIMSDAPSDSSPEPTSSPPIEQGSSLTPQAAPVESPSHTYDPPIPFLDPTPIQLTRIPTQSPSAVPASITSSPTVNWSDTTPSVPSSSPLGQPGSHVLYPSQPEISPSYSPNDSATELPVASLSPSSFLSNSRPPIEMPNVSKSPFANCETISPVQAPEEAHPSESSGNTTLTVESPFATIPPTSGTMPPSYNPSIQNFPIDSTAIMTPSFSPEASYFPFDAPDGRESTPKPTFSKFISPTPTFARPSSSIPSLLPRGIASYEPIEHSTLNPINEGAPSFPFPTTEIPADSTTSAPAIESFPSQALLPSFLPNLHTITPSLVGHVGSASSQPITPAPTVETIPTPDRDICQSIEQQMIPPNLSERDPTIFGATMDVQYTFISSKLVINYLDSMNVPVALWIASCEDHAMKYISSDSKRHDRRLQDSLESTAEYSIVEPWGLYGECATLDISVLRSRIESALSIFSVLVTDQTGVLAIRVNAIEFLDDANNSGMIRGEDNENYQVNTAVVVGAVATGLGAFLLTLMCVVIAQRGLGAKSLAHSRWVENLEESHTFDNQLISPDCGAQRNNEDGSYEYETQVIHHHADEDKATDTLSVAPLEMETWSPFATQPDDTPFDDAKEIFWTSHSPDRPHQCSAATCEVCERKRQQGIQPDSLRCVVIFPPAPPERAPSQDPDRWFIIGDTVQL